MSFFLFYIQISRPMKWLRYASYAGAAVNVVFYVTMVIVTIAVTCPIAGQPVELQIQSSRPRNGVKSFIPVSVMNLILDVYILVLPIAGVSKLQLPLRRKIGVMAMFLTGLA